jgi:hypothetical protein
MGGEDWVAAAMKRCRSGCGNDPLTCIPDDAPLTQYGQSSSDPVFRNGRRSHEPGLSLLVGALSAMAASEAVRGQIVGAREVALARARVSTAGELRRARFLVIHTPSGKRLGHDHVTVCLQGTDGEPLFDADWDPDSAVLFDSCFNETPEDEEQ